MNEEQVKKLVAESLAETLADKDVIAEFSKAVKAASIEDKNIRAKEGEQEKSIIKWERMKAPFVTVGIETKKMLDGVRMMVKTGPSGVVNETTDEEGGFTVSEEFGNVVIEYMALASVVRKYATVVKMNKLKMRLPKLDQTSSLFGGVALAWEEESTPTTSTQPAFKALTLTAHKMIGTVPASTEILEDSDIDMANYLVNLFGRAAAYMEDKAFLSGGGTTVPQGVIGKGTVVNRTTSDEVTYDDIIELEGAIPASILGGSIYIVSRSALKGIKLLKDKNDRPLWQPGISSGMGNAFPATINGYPYELVEDDRTAALGYKGDVIFGNFTYYVIGDRRDMTVAVSPHVNFVNDELMWRFTKRVDGQPSIDTAFAILDVPAGS